MSGLTVLKVIDCAFPALLAFGFAVAADVLAPVWAFAVDGPVMALAVDEESPPSEIEPEIEPDSAVLSEVEVVRLEASIGAKMPPLLALEFDPELAAELDPEAAEFGELVMS